MKTIHVNKYFFHCYSLLAIILGFMNHYEYEENAELVLLSVAGSLVFLPFELYCSKAIYYICKKQNFTVIYFSSIRTISVT